LPITLDQGPINIDRFDRNRRAVLTADLAGKASLEEAMKAIYALSVMKSHPSSVKFSESGDAENMPDLFDGFANAMKFGLMMVYAVLVLLFGSFLQPITILFSLPLSIGGAIIALLLAGMQLTVPVAIGILMLMGIVTKNAIMLVDFAIESIHAGMPRDEAIIDAGLKRARPIVMTTIAMVAGMIPSALAYGDGGAFRAPMAYAVIGGLMFSTALSLIFVPDVFIMMDNVSQFLSHTARRFIDGEARDDLVKKPAQSA
jgi:multidrug efflux pump subunit AcrB